MGAAVLAPQSQTARELEVSAAGMGGRPFLILGLYRFINIIRGYSVFNIFRALILNSNIAGELGLSSAGISSHFQRRDYPEMKHSS